MRTLDLFVDLTSYTILFGSEMKGPTTLIKLKILKNM
jgi:hypothetical protein